MCCDGICGPLTGCNCSACMKLDIKARVLPLGWLVNSEGFNSRKNGNDGLFYCGRQCRVKKNGSIGFCGPSSGKNCKSCKKLDMMAKERYGVEFETLNSFKNSGFSTFFGSIKSFFLNPFDFEESN